jgi:hypothetical protein
MGGPPGVATLGAAFPHLGAFAAHDMPAEMEQPPPNVSAHDGRLSANHGIRRDPLSDGRR